MKKIFLLIFIMFFPLGIYAQEADSLNVTTGDTPVQEVVDNDFLWEKGNEAYIAGNFDSAIESYEKIIADGKYSLKLYYNLANAYFKSGEIGKAILFYHRVLRINPSFDDAKYNLSIAETQTKDKITALPEFFLSSWAKSFRSIFGCTAWSIISLVLLFVVIAAIIVFLLSSRLKVRKIGFYTGLAGALLLFCSVLCASSRRSEMVERNEAILLSSATSVKGSPDSSATELFVLHEGTKFEILTEVDDWCEIVIADGKKGWVKVDTFERI